MIRSLAALFAFAVCSIAAQAGTTCEDIQENDLSFTVCTVDATTSDLRLFLRRSDGGVHGSFQSINRMLAEADQQLEFAMNAGMYHATRAPVGYYLEDGNEEQALITSAGPGNFGMLPNGVLCVAPGRVDVLETLQFRDTAPKCTSATQSGPMLVVDNRLHPRFLPDSTSRYVRNGVGTTADGSTAYFAISNQPVTFHEFASLFKNRLGTPNALYFDGNISRLHAPGLNRSDSGFAMGPIIGVVAPRDN